MIILYLITVSAFSSSLAQLSKRDTTLETVLIPLNLDNKQRYTVSVNMVRNSVDVGFLQIIDETVLVWRS